MINSEIDESQKIIHNFETLLENIQKDGLYVKYASKALRDDEIIMKAAVAKNSWAAQYASIRLKKDKDFVFMCLERNGDLMEFFKDFKNDLQAALIAVGENGSSLEHVSQKLKDNKELCLKAVKNNAFAARFISARLSSDKEVALAVIQKSPQYIEHMCGDIQTLYNNFGKEGLMNALLQESLKAKSQSRKIKI